MGAIEQRMVAAPHGPAAAFVLTDAQVAELGGGKRPAVLVEVNGERSARLRLWTMGGVNAIGLSKAARAELGVEIGDEVDVRITLDEAPREVDLPAELEDALAGAPDARAAFDALAYTHRKEFATWVRDAKRPETKHRRVAETLTMLREGRHRD